MLPVMLDYYCLPSVDRITNDPTAEQVRLVLCAAFCSRCVKTWYSVSPKVSKTQCLRSDSNSEISEDLNVGLMYIWEYILNREPTTGKIQETLDRAN